jgi:glycosyltransferase involved in cell wall biosynthesis
LLIGNYRADAQESMQRFAALMKTELEYRGHDVRLVAPEARVGRASDAFTWRGYVDKYALFPHELKRALRWADVAHICDHSNAIYTRYLSSTPHVVTCHDMLAIRSALGEFPANPVRWSGRQLQRMIVAGLRRASRIVCDTASTRSDVLRIAAIPEPCVSVVALGQNYPYSPLAAQESLQRVSKMGVSIERPFILHVGGNQWYKNRVGVLRIFEGLVRRGLEAKLVLVGKPWTTPMREFVVERRLSDRVILIDGADNEDLRALYSLAHMLLFPSLYEGFGWPVIEAQACGCPVVTSDRAPMTDVAGSAAVFVTPEDADGAAATIASKWGELQLLRVPGLVNAARFSVASMIDGYLRQYAVALA